MVSTTELSRPTIFLLSLSESSLFDDIYPRLIDLISSKAKIQRATKPGPASTYLQTKRPSAIFITDAGVLDPAYAQLLQAVVAYGRSGGTVVMGALFSNFVTGNDMDHMFEAWEVPWDRGDYCRTQVYLNEKHAAVEERVMAVDGLANGYSQKAVFLTNVPKDAALYLPSDQSMTQSMVFASEKMDAAQTPVAFTRVGEGWLGYVGDVNPEKESDSVYMAMFGL